MAEENIANGIAEDGSEMVMNEEQFVRTYKPQFIASGVPEHLWKTVFQKITEETYDLGQYVKEVQERYKDQPTEYGLMVYHKRGIKAQDSTSIFLVDHAWTFELKEARQHLTALPSLLQRMCRLMTVDCESLDTQQAIDVVMQRIWKYVQTYKIRTADMEASEARILWYMTDEVGCKLRHSEKPNCRMVPFTTPQCIYSLLWPLRDVSKDEELTVNRVHCQNSDPLVYQARAQPWNPTDMTHVTYMVEEPPAEYFEKFRQTETLPDPNMVYQPLSAANKLRVFLRYQNFAEYLMDDRFTLVDSPEEADIVWITQSFKDYEELSLNHPGRHINQFPCEMVLTIKDLLAIISRRAAKNTPSSDPLAAGPKWLPVTFNLETELPQFVSHFQNRDRNGLDNTWICKPWNLARGMDITITDNLHCITRLPETGPKVACKYIEDPVLFDRGDIGKVKFDIRYIVLLRSSQPLKLYAYKVFWLRFANIAFSLDNFEEYEKHFTVMNYVPTNLKQIHYDEFIPMFEEQYPDFPYADVEKSIFEMFRELFEAAVSKPPPQGLGHSPQSRSMYAIDLLLKWDKTDTGERCIVPQLCEVNFCPDCERACKYHPFFVNDVFSTLFLDDTEGKHVELIS